MKLKTLRSHITLTICLITALALVCSGLFFYRQTSQVLTDNYRQLILLQLNQINKQIDEQITLIDSLPPLFMSNTLIQDALDPPYPEATSSYAEKKLLVEKQMSYLLINHYLRSVKLVDAVVIFDNENHYYSVAPENRKALTEKNKEVLDLVPAAETGLMIRSLPEQEDSIYFIRNIFSIYSGEKIATMVITVNQRAWIRYYSENLDKDWFVYLHNENIDVLSEERMSAYTDLLAGPLSGELTGILKEQTLGDRDYFIASAQSRKAGITSLVAAPKSQLFEELNDTLKTYAVVLLFIVAASLLISIVLSQAVTRPIDKMITHVKGISKGQQEKMPALEMYSEFNEFATAFNQMLEKLDLYYRDIFDKQLLLKNAEIQALQAQMDPHFLLNVLNTIAWKAQMTDNQDVYQMVISLGELLKLNTISKTNAFISLEEELSYVRFYVYLQRMRFEDRITVEIQASPSLLHYQIPCFCIQPLVENAIVHGLEPKKGPGRLILNIIPTGDYMEISVIDNGIGFREPPDIRNITPSMEDTHTHIGLHNLDKRLFLLFGEDSCLQITSIPNQCTTISFKVPYRTGSANSP